MFDVNLATLCLWLFKALVSHFSFTSEYLGMFFCAGFSGGSGTK